MLGVSGFGPVRVWPQILVDIAAVVIHQVVAALDNLFCDRIRNALRLRAIRLAGIKAVHALAVHRIHVRHFLLKGRNIDQRQDDDGAGNLRGIEHLNDFLQGDDGGVFSSVRAGNQSKHRAGLVSSDDDNGDRSSCVNASGDFQSAGGFLSRSGRGGAYGKAVLRQYCNGTETGKR